MTEKISQGSTFKGFISSIGLTIIVFSVITIISGFYSNFAFVVVLVGITCLTIGLVLFLSIKGVLIDVSKKLIKPYFNIVIAKIGAWESLEQYNKLVLKYCNESQTMNYKSISSDILTRSFDIVLSSNNNREIYLKEFTDYPCAKTFLEEYSKKLNLTPIDTYELIRQQINNRRYKTRR